MRKHKPLVFIGILLLVFGSIVCINTVVTPVSGVTPPFSAKYTWLGGYLNNTLTMVNLTDGTLYTRTVMNTTWDYWEDEINYTITTSSPNNVLTPMDDFDLSYTPIYSTELTTSVGLDVWYNIRLQWRTAAGDGKGKYGDIDTDYVTFGNASGTYAVTSGGVVPVPTTPDGSWFDGATNGAGSMWALQTLYTNVTMFLVAPPPGHLTMLPLVTVDQNNWMSTGDTYTNITYPGHPLHGMEASCSGRPWDADMECCVTAASGHVINSQIIFHHPTSGNDTPMNVSIIFAQKQLIARNDVLLHADATLDGNVNVWDLGRMSDWWLTDVKSKWYGVTIGEYEDSGNFAEAYRISKEINSLDFNGDELVNVWDLGILSDNWLKSGWSPPVIM